MNAEDAIAFVCTHGVVLASAKGTAPRLTEAIVGEPIKGSWWAHPQSHRIYAVLGAVMESREVLVCRLINDRITLVHRRLWPSLVALSAHFEPGQLAQVRDEHTASGRHARREIAFPLWVPPDVAELSATISEPEAFAVFAEWIPIAKQRVRRPARIR